MAVTTEVHTLEEIRRIRGYSRIQAAMLLGISDDRLYNFECYKTPVPVSIAVKMASLYEVSTDDIIFLCSKDTQKA